MCISPMSLSLSLSLHVSLHHACAGGYGVWSGGRSEWRASCERCRGATNGADVAEGTGLYGANGPKRFQIIRVYDITRLPQVACRLLPSLALSCPLLPSLALSCPERASRPGGHVVVGICDMGGGLKLAGVDRRTRVSMSYCCRRIRARTSWRRVSCRAFSTAAMFSCSSRLENVLHSAQVSFLAQMCARLKKMPRWRSSAVERETACSLPRFFVE
jgi:hypothetical protein